MSAKVMPPIHPGELLFEEFLKPLGISPYRLAKELSVPPRRINEIVLGKRGISADTALRLARFFGTSDLLWLNMQNRYDLEVARDRLEGRLKKEVSVFTGKENWLAAEAATADLRRRNATARPRGCEPRGRCWRGPATRTRVAPNHPDRRADHTGTGGTPMSSRSVLALAALALLTLAAPSRGHAAEGNKARPAGAALTPSPLVIGDTFTLDSAALGETRRINVYAPPGYAESPDQRLPVLYMPDGGLGEDFLHIAGLVQIGAINGTMRPFLLVGIENTQRRRDLTGPTTDERDLAIAPKVGGSAAYCAFLRDELRPRIDATYRTTGETAIVGESLAGLFVVESFLQEPGLFDTAIAIDPSLWWNHAALVEGAAARLAALPDLKGTLFLASSDEPEIEADTARLAGILAKAAPTGLKWSYAPLPAEQHSTIYHPAALRAFREVFAPVAGAGE